MTVEELIAELATLCPESVVTVVDPHLHIDCHPRVSVEPWIVCLESTGRVVTEEDVS